MFDFTTTTFIHDADMIEANPVNGNSGSSDKVLRLENKIFKYEDVVAIYRNPYVAPMNAKLYVDVEGFMADEDASNAKRFKLDFYIRRSGDNNSFYSNDFVFKGKDFHYEWTNKQNDATKVAKMINKIIRLYGDVYLKVYTETISNKTWLVFENDNYAVFTDALLKVYVPDQGDCCSFREGGWEVIDELPGEKCLTGEASCTTSPQVRVDSIKNDPDASPAVAGYMYALLGVNGFGTYEQLLKDLRLPTMENFRWTSLNESEMPIPGNLYTQYTIHQISCRGVLGGSAVGEVTHSKTTHVFFVPSCGCGESLDEVLYQAISDAGMKAKLITTTGSLNGEGATAEELVLNGDPTPDPGTIESFVHDASIKSKMTNTTEESEETEP